MSKRTRRQIAQPLQWMNRPFTPHEPQYNAEIEAGPLRTGLIWLTATHPQAIGCGSMLFFALVSFGALIASIILASALLLIVAGLAFVLALCVPACLVFLVRRLTGIPKPFIPPTWYRWSRGRQSRVKVEYAKPGTRHKKRHSP